MVTKRALATQIHNANRKPVGTQLNPLLQEPIRSQRASAEYDDHDIAVGVVVGMGFEFLEGRVVELLAEARHQTAQDRVATLDKAMRYLTQARIQAGGK